MHLLRNAISHGIETPAERASKGKSPVGSLTLRLDSQRGRLIVEVDDDGRGVNLKKVANVLSHAEPGAHSPEELARVIFRPGFSTSATVNHLSGRGMGLSVVYETVQRLQGDVDLRPKDTPGASFLLSVPFVGIHQPFAAALLRGTDLRNPHSRNRAALSHRSGAGADSRRETRGESGRTNAPPVRIGPSVEHRRRIWRPARRHAAGHGVEIGRPAFRCMGG